MRTAIVTVLVVFATLAVATGTGAVAREARLPVPPIPPANKPPIEAPLPDFDVQVPYTENRRSTFTLDSEINHRASPATRFGFSPRGHYQIDNERKLRLPGFFLRLPLP